MADKLHLDRTYTYAGAHYGPGVLHRKQFEEDGTTDTFDALSKRHAAVLKAEAPMQVKPARVTGFDEDIDMLEDREDKINPDHMPEDVPPVAPGANDGTGTDEGTDDIPGNTPEEKALYAKTNKELAKQAQENGIDVSGITKKSDLVAALIGGLSV